ncbi:outer membrane protein assembly factor BamD [Hartmannibacter diazotrophicus]|nr:outer membrane protein assembly factor BamD [Hartmannibacter diazotrophicus]
MASSRAVRSNLVSAASGRRVLSGALAGSLLALLTACSSDPVDDLAFKDIPAEKSYNEGLAYIKAGDLREATKKFEEVDQQHPYSEWARKSMIMTAYTNFTRGRYDDAIISARRYVTLYPGSEDAAYAQYMIGQSYFQQIPDVDRDQDMTRKALQAMTELVQRYPDSSYALEAQRVIDVCRDQLAGKEMEIGRYYLARYNYIAAVNRFRNVVTEYQTTRHTEEALERLTEAYFALGIVNEAQTAAAILGHNYPESQWYKDAYSLLQTKGLEPREDTGSWISRTFKAALG